MNAIEPAVSKASIQFHTMSAKGGGDSFRGERVEYPVLFRKREGALYAGRVLHIVPK